MRCALVIPALALLLFCVPLLSRGQSIAITGHMPGVACAGAPLSVSFTTTGTFQASNLFTVQLSADGGGTFVDLPGSFTASPVSCTVPATTLVGKSYTYRVVSSSPRVASRLLSSPLWIYRRPTAQLIGHNGGEAPINPYTPVRLAINASGGNPYTFTLTDSTKLNQGDELPSDGTTVRPARTETFKLASVQNFCGYGTVSGSATVQVNPIDFVLTSPTGNPNLCVGGMTPIHFSTRQPLPPNTRFEAQLIESSGAGGRTLTMPISGTSSPLQLRVPDDYVFNTGGYAVYLRVFAREAGLSAQQQVFFSYVPITSIGVSSSVIMPGEETTVLVTAPWGGGQQWLINDGKTGNQLVWRPAFLDQVGLPLRPTEPTTYSLVGPVGIECSADVKYLNRTASVSIAPGVQILGISRTSVCTGDPVSISYSAPAGYVMPQYVEVRYGNSLTSARLSRPGEVTFTAFSEGSLSSFVQLIDGATRNPISARFPVALTIRTQPRFTFGTNRVTRSLPGNEEFWGVLYSGGLTSMTLNTGHVLQVTGGYGSGHPSESTSVRFPPLYVAQTQAFSVVAIQNECGLGKELNSGRLEVVVERPTTSPTLLLQETVARRNEFYTPCPTAFSTLNVVRTGTFGADNVYRLETIQSNPNTGPVVTRSEAVTLAGGSLSIPTPTTPGISYRLVASNPTVQSNLLAVTSAAGKPSVRFSVQSAPDHNLALGDVRVVARGEPVTLDLSFTGQPPFSYTLSDGTPGYTEFRTSTLMFRPQQTGLYRVARIVNACGQEGTDSDSVRLSVVSARLSIRGADVRCAETAQQLAFSWIGQPPTSATYSLELTTDEGFTYRPIPTAGSSSPLSYTLPTQLGGTYSQLRLVAHLPDQSVINSFRVRINTIDAPPSMTLIADGRVVLNPSDPSSSVTLRVLAGSGSAPTLVLSDGQVSNTSNTFRVSKPGVYSLISAVNRCGYGHISGTVQVFNQAGVSRLEAQRNTVCESETAQLSFTAQGDFQTGNRFRLFLENRATGNRTLLTEITSLSATVPISPGPNRPVGTYGFRVESTAPSLTVTQGQLVVQAPLRGTLVREALSIYPGEGVNLWLTPNGQAPYSLTLSDGERFTTTWSGNTIIRKQPTQTTSYSVAQSENSCGLGTFSGVVSITVLPASAVRVRPLSSFTHFCTGQTAVLSLDTQGTFGTDNSFTAELSDSTGSTFRQIPSISSPQRLTVTIPSEWSTGVSGYVFRVRSTSPQHIGASSANSFGVFSSPAGTLTGNNSIFKGDSTRISVALTGTPPWQLTITDLFGPRTFTASQSPFTLTVKPDTTMGFRLTEVRNNQCGVGTASGTALITVSRLLATEPALSVQVRVWPNPTSGTLQLEGELDSQASVQVRIQTLLGTLVQSQTVQPTGGQLRTQLDLSQLPTGTYLLTAEQDGRRSVFKVLKE